MSLVLFPQDSHGAKQQHAYILGSKGLRASQVVLVVKNLPANAGDTRDVGSVLGWGRPPPEKEMATHSSILAWEIPWTKESARLYSPWDRTESDIT